MATTQELLDHLGKFVLRDRPTTVVGGVSEPLWPDELLVVLLNKAQTLFARRTHCIVDSTTQAVTEIAVVPGTATYALHQSVLVVRNARFAGDVADLVRVTHDELHPRTNASVYPWLSDFTQQPGKPRMYSTQEQTRLLELSAVPDAAYTLHLRVARLPIAQLTLSDLEATPEIPEEYHLDLCDWAAYLALTNQEVDGTADEKAMSFRAQFMETMRWARQDIQRAEDAPVRFFFGTW